MSDEIQEKLSTAPELTPEEIQIKEQEEKNKVADELHEEKCRTFAEDIIQILARHKPTGKDLAKKHEEYLAVFSPIQQEIAKEMTGKGFTISDCGYIFSIVQGILDQARNLTISSLQDVFERSQRKLFEVDDMASLTLQQIDDILKSE